MFQNNTFIKILKLNSIIFASSIFISGLLFPEGFIGSTLVKTQLGYEPIDRLEENNFITAYSFKEKDAVPSRIKKVVKKNYSKCYKLIINGKEIIAAPDQKLFCPLRKGGWIKVQDIQQNDFIIRNLKDLVRVERITELKESNDFFCLTIDSNHNYLFLMKMFLYTIQLQALIS